MDHPWYYAYLQDVNIDELGDEFIEDYILPYVYDDNYYGIDDDIIIKILSDRHDYNMDGTYIDRYVNENGNEGMREIVNTGNPYAIRHLRKSLSPLERETNVDPFVNELVNEKVQEVDREIENDRIDNSDQLELPLSGTWVQRYIVAEFGRELIRKTPSS